MDDIVLVMEEHLAKEGKVTFRVKGSSMSPFLVSQVTAVTIVTPKEYRKGDVVLFKANEGKYILHRIVREKEDCFITQGDALYSRENCPRTNVIGKMESFETGGKLTLAESKTYRMQVVMWKIAKPFVRAWQSLRRRLGKKDDNG